MPVKTAAQPAITVADIDLATLSVPIRGLTPLLPQKWTEAALEQMRAKQQSAKMTTVQKPKDPMLNAHQSTYWLSDDQPGIPAGAFKSALVSAVGLFKGLTKVGSKMMFMVEGEGPDNLVPIIDCTWEAREFQVRNATGVADLRYFNVIMPWRAVLNVTYPPSLIEASAVASLVDAAGKFAGVGGYRPSAPKVASGTYGRWEIVRD